MKLLPRQYDRLQHPDCQTLALIRMAPFFFGKDPDSLPNAEAGG
jgi:hypothetical protein